MEVIDPINTSPSSEEVLIPEEVQILKNMNWLGKLFVNLSKQNKTHYSNLNKKI